jgi:hypothetical protein
MVAALAYNPAKNDGFQVRVYGTVSDDSGVPLSNITVGFGGTGLYATTDEKGHYSMELDSDQIDIPGKLECSACSPERTHWAQAKNVTLAVDVLEASLNFTLANNTDVILPTGPIVLASTLPGLTRVDISTYLQSASQCQFIFNGSSSSSPGLGGARTPFPGSPNNVSFKRTSDSGSLTFPGISGYLSRQYYDTPINIKDYSSALMSYYDGNDRVMTNETLSKDYLSPVDVTNHSTFYNLTLGESVTISASPEQNATLPEGLSPKVDCDLLGLHINENINCTYQYSSYRYVWGTLGDYTKDVNTTASVTITPLTSGTHHYQVYIEQGYIIHVWELMDQTQ